MSFGQRSVKVYELGTTHYRDVHLLQQRLQAQRRQGNGVDSLLLTEHRPVFTLGRSHPEPDLRVPPDFVREQGIDIIQTERGGDITYHGPGQLVAYGIVDLKEWDLGVVDFVAGLEEVAMRVLGDWSLPAEQLELGRGVWVHGKKIASVGLHVRRWVTMHGIALNVDPNLAHFDLINPCGMSDVRMTSMKEELSHSVPMPAVHEAFVYHFGDVFACESELVDMTMPRAAAR